MSEVVKKRYYRKESYLSNYSFLKEYIEEHIYITCCTILEDKQVTKKRLDKDINLRLDDVIYILALWQLYLYDQNQYIPEETIQDINTYLTSLSSMNTLKRQGYISYKDIQRVEATILSDIYAHHFNLEPKQFRNFSDESLDFLHFGTKYLDNFEHYIPEEWAPYEKIKKSSVLNSKPLPSQVYVWIVRKELTKNLLHTIADKYDQKISEYNIKRFNKTIDTLYVNYYVSGIGDIPTICIVLLLVSTNNNLKIPDNKPNKFYQRLDQYKEKYTAMVEYLLNLYE